MTLDNGGFTEAEDRVLSDDNRRKRERWYNSEIKQLKERVSKLLKALDDLADECEDWVNAQYKRDGEVYHPALQRRYDRDMESVLQARQLITEAKGEQ